MKIIFEAVVEFGLVLIHFPSNILRLFINFNYVNPDPENASPIILVERWFTRNPFHIFAKKHLEKKGFRVYSLNYSFFKGNFKDAGINLKTFIEKHRIKNAVLVGISGGAVTCMEYLENLNGWENTKLFISLGGPVKGSPVAKTFSFVPGVSELDPDGIFMKTLLKKITNKERMITIQAKYDNMVPEGYSDLPGVKNIVIDMAGHNLLHTFYMPTYDLIADLSSK